MVVAAIVLVIVFNSKGPTAEKVSLMLDWTPNANHTGIYVAYDKGWFAEEGIDLEIIAPAGVTVETVVGSGKAEFGISFQEYVTSARIEGVPIVSIAAIIQHNTSGFISLKDRGITKAADFAGHSYGGFGLQIEKAIISAMITRDGGSPESVKYVNVSEGDLLSMLGRDIDFAWIYYGVEGIEAAQRSLEVDYVEMSDYFDAVPDYYTPVIISSEKLIAENPQMVERFMAAVARGYEYAIENPAESAEILLKHAPELSPESVKASQDWLSPRYAEDAPQWGYQQAEVWKDFGDWMYNNGLIAGEFDYQKAYTNRFIPEK
ncbi:MAG TPA: ABC transporter substrate-binding protein [Firmicutes bacterium]|jgi:ABC-type nitrate/sulfonate/bicarbonate transport system substrate-binding protein|nr:ABC transporter substrate-binding protein [Bacillota bacterium]HCM17311.1 ABC transporter substrate-binding protein [Bacillota bacterium]HCX71995.1 ABC transporter substrate-binding protein [Bacillota bacterium]